MALLESDFSNRRDVCYNELPSCVNEKDTLYIFGGGQLFIEVQENNVPHVIEVPVLIRILGAAEYAS
jgi:hypothetical protein